MTEENKKLLFREICNRIDYKLKVEITINDKSSPEYGQKTIGEVYGVVCPEDDDNVKYYTIITTYGEYGSQGNHVENVKPYLRPISTMTNDECDELFKILDIDEKHDWLKINDIGIIRLFSNNGKDMYQIQEALDYLKSIHIDYCDLIRKNLALEAENNMY